METVAKTHDAFASEGSPTYDAQPTYLDALTFLDEFDAHPLAEGGTISGCQVRTNSLWVLGLQQSASDRRAKTEAPIASPCLPQVAHFNIRWHDLYSALAHCDFRSVQLPGFDRALASLSDLDDVLQLMHPSSYTFWGASSGVDHELESITYADVDYVPRRRRYLDANVSINPHGKSVPRLYTDEDAETWEL